MKRPHFQWLASLWWIAPAALAVNYCVYQLVRGSPSLPAAFVIFAGVTLAGRLIFSLVVGHPIGVGTWLAMGLLAAANALRWWRP